MHLDYCFYVFQLALREAVVPCQLDFRFKPVFCLAARTFDMDMHPGFLAREKEKAIAFFTEYRGAHPDLDLLSFSNIIFARGPVKKNFVNADARAEG